MGRALTTGQMCDRLDGFVYKRKEEETENVPLSQYITEKVKLLHELYYMWVTEEYFDGCTSEIQVDNRAHTIIFGGVQKRYITA